MNSQIHQIQSLIDECKEKLGDGDYLKLCDSMKELHNLKPKIFYKVRCWLLKSECCCSGHIIRKKVSFISKKPLECGLLENFGVENEEDGIFDEDIYEFICQFNPDLRDMNEYFHLCCREAEWTDMEVIIISCDPL